jgi:AcrR family transcriptional regulator
MKAVRKRPLRTRLLELARCSVEVEGHESLSLRALAAEAGVAPSAPYRHFSDRATLLQAVAEVGYGELLELYKAAVRQHEKPKNQLAAIIRSVLRYGRENPNILRLMFRSELIRQLTTSPNAKAAFDLFESVLRALPASRSPSTRIHALSLASALRGAMLAELGGFFEPFGDSRSVERVVDDIIVRYSD